MGQTPATPGLGLPVALFIVVPEGSIDEFIDVQAGGGTQRQGAPRTMINEALEGVRQALLSRR